MTTWLIVNGILSAAVVIVIVGMLARAIQADRAPRVARELRAEASSTTPASAASLVIASAE
jgi:hypothetical protein